MDEERRPYAIAGALLVALLAVLFAGPWLKRELAPEPFAAWVAIDVGDGVARVGPVAIPAGTPCTLHAVLEARTRGGEPLYFTEARALALAGEEVPAERLRPWTGPQEARVLWFSVEGSRPYLQIGPGLAPAVLAFQEIFRPDWPRAWSVPCRLEASSEAFARGVREILGGQSFGTQRYHVRVELYARGGALAPQQRFRSPGGAELPARAGEFPAVVASLPGALAVPSSVFGLTQVEAPLEAAGGLAGEIARWTRERLAFSRLTLLDATLAAAGRRWESLAWAPVDLRAGPAWGEGGVAPGDLARVGARVAVLLADRGAAGRLDREDLCFDYDKGPGVRPLGEVFVGDGLVEWVPLTGPAAAVAAVGPREDPWRSDS